MCYIGKELDLCLEYFFLFCNFEMLNFSPVFFKNRRRGAKQLSNTQTEMSPNRTAVSRFVLK